VTNRRTLDVAPGSLMADYIAARFHNAPRLSLKQRIAHTAAATRKMLAPKPESETSSALILYTRVLFPLRAAIAKACRLRPNHKRALMA
jgi:hypothetical protein